VGLLVGVDPHDLAGHERLVPDFRRPPANDSPPA
jgi:hypothetical protein